MNKDALSPLMATFILVVFSLIIGTLTMNWGKSFVDNFEEAETPDATIVIHQSDLNTELKQLQIEYIQGKISEEEYLAREQEVLS
ncbi:MAG TPA: hypothetical protein VJH97_06160 [Candidatus Nanoarchaeia archaeon]|nr:hypothetical protein [Candidatus Nanoarchaeia archaeon]